VLQLRDLRQACSKLRHLKAVAFLLPFNSHQAWVSMQGEQVWVVKISAVAAATKEIAMVHRTVEEEVRDLVLIIVEEVV